MTELGINGEPAATKATEDPLVEIARRLLEEIGEDPARDGLRDTPGRFARWWREFIDYEPGSLDTLFESIGTSQLVVVSDIQVWSLCEHHLLPFRCSVTIAYRPTGKLLGLSKFARVAHQYAHRLQVQERLVDQIALEISTLSGTSDVAVIAKGEHLCMTMRGVKAPAQMTSTAYRGQFGTDPQLRGELFDLIRA
ncbi:GTP cyclohydrolase I [Amycolatopsis sp. PS_44_ISF1]|uniref:GTP cyclohydrolase I n=1 Tax=Amycolatopsis sp. PS_44_ISF1 TaxID=2974917 RepID=UPI0028DFD2DA|nr:GTP cyclohydrolase I [Amycolatopsis sp. PS_44_ISF1]MDT8912001.1 GTP cyclohydrolase I [Amycolatopsis sp. PS_44_ISF1]